MNKYDVIIIGAGPSGIFCAYELMRQKPDMKVLMIEKGRSIEKRQCPKRTTKVCVGCSRRIFRWKAISVTRCRGNFAGDPWL